MAYSLEVVQRARKRLESAKADAESVQQQHLQHAYIQVPRLKQIDLELRRSMALAAQAAFTKGIDAKEAMEQVKQANLSLQQERAALVARNFPEGYLSEEPICSRCGGSGYIGTQMCRCLQELCRQEQRKELSVLACGEGSFQDFRLEYYPERVDPKYGFSPRAIMEGNFRVCKRFAENFSGGSGNLLLVGGTGLGKTFLSACIARTVADNGYAVAYETASHLFGKLERNRFSPDEQSRADVAKMEQCDLLIVDDLGTELPGNFVTAALYNLINDRLLGGKSMVISTNLTVEELGRRYSPQIASRLQGNFQRLTFVGDDIRIKKSRGETV